MMQGYCYTCVEWAENEIIIIPIKNKEELANSEFFLTCVYMRLKVYDSLAHPIVIAMA